ncbi:MAG: 50S ribosomal protein L27 [Candidatus Sungbacteria bacterium]|nr:50S ribosomal protein L27 [Candidatus Sungbacteria bacterium]
MAHTKSGGSTKYGRDAQPKYLGIKKSDGQIVKTGNILIRQRGAKFLAGTVVKRGGDDTLYAMRDGIVKFLTKRKIRFDGTLRRAKVVTVVPAI